VLSFVGATGVSRMSLFLPTDLWSDRFFVVYHRSALCGYVPLTGVAVHVRFPFLVRPAFAMDLPRRPAPCLFSRTSIGPSVAWTELQLPPWLPSFRLSTPAAVYLSPETAAADRPAGDGRPLFVRAQLAGGLRVARAMGGGRLGTGVGRAAAAADCGVLRLLGWHALRSGSQVACMLAPSDARDADALALDQNVAHQGSPTNSQPHTSPPRGSPALQQVATTGACMQRHAGGGRRVPSSGDASGARLNLHVQTLSRGARITRHCAAPAPAWSRLARPID